MFQKLNINIKKKLKQYRKEKCIIIVLKKLIYKKINQKILNYKINK